MQGTHLPRKSSFTFVLLSLFAFTLLIIGFMAFFPSHASADAIIVTHQVVGPQIPIGQSGTLSVSCNSGEHLLSGGFYGDAFEGAVYTTESYPSAANTWTVTVNNTGGPSWVEMTVSVYCLHSTSAVTTTIVHAIGSGPSVASCPTGSALIGGGYAGSSIVSMSRPQGNGWQTNEANAYAVCATQGLTADLAVSTTFSVPGVNQNAGAGVSCNSGQLTTGGGFSASGPIVSSQLGTGSWGVAVAGIDFNPSTATAWAVCVSPSLIAITPTVTVTRTPVPIACRVSYRVTSQWPSGFGANIVITNTGTTAINGWIMKFSFANGQTVTHLWNGSYTQSGSAVTVTNLSYNATIAPGGMVNPGFNGTWSGTNPNPTSFTLNGQSCLVA